MIVINFDEYNLNRNAVLQDLPTSLFVYPTDSIYSLGCNATDEACVNRIRKIKNSMQPFSVIVPTKDWIYENCVVTEEAEEWVRKLPGPYTLVLKLKNPKAVAKNVVGNNGVISVRMPNHWFLVVSFFTKLPLVCTSANVSGHDIMSSLEDLDLRIRNNVDYVFYDGPKKGIPLTVVHLEGSRIEIHPKLEKNIDRKNIQFPLEEIQLTRKK